MAKRKSKSFNFLKKQKREKSKIKVKSFCAPPPPPPPPHTHTPPGLVENGSDSPKTLPPFWNTGTLWATEKAWARITAESRMFGWENDSNEEKKGTDTVRGYKMSKRVYRSAVKSVLLSVIGSIFWQPIWGGNVNFMGHFFSWQWKILQGRALE